MRSVMVAALFVVGLVAHGAGRAAQSPSATPGSRLGAMTWTAAEERLGPGTIVVLPLGSGATQHGQHLTLDTDQRLAEYLAGRLSDLSGVVVAPALPYHYEAAFLEYPGSTSVSRNVARDLVADIARSLARHGPRRFYALNTGTSTDLALADSAALLGREGILLRATDLRARLDAVIRSVRKQPYGRHADEVETSMMLFVDPARVTMARATRELAPESAPFRLSRAGDGQGTYSPSGVWGDATLATREKGEALVEALVIAVKSDIEDLRRSTPPVPTAALTAGTAARSGRGEPRGSGRPDECLPGDDRAIRAIGPGFSLAWRNQDAERLSQFWAAGGDVGHPDGYVEGTAQIIRQNRASLFMRPEYRGSTHALLIGQIRCLTGDVAVADGMWDLRNVTGARGERLPPMAGLCTLVLKRTAEGWRIEAYRYTIKENQNISPPTLLSRPGLPAVIR
jgi:creatinine amidohydrolase